MWGIMFNFVIREEFKSRPKLIICNATLLNVKYKHVNWAQYTLLRLKLITTYVACKQVHILVCLRLFI